MGLPPERDPRLDADDITLEITQYVLDLLSLQWDGVAPPCPELLEQHRVFVFVLSRLTNRPSLASIRSYNQKL